MKAIQIPSELRTDLYSSYYTVLKSDEGKGFTVLIVTRYIKLRER